MGVCLTAYTVTDEKIRAILANPPLVWRIVAPDDPRIYLREIGQAKSPGFLAKLFGVKQPLPPEIPDLPFAENEWYELDMDKAWDGVNFCLKRLQVQCPNFFEDGQPVGKVEIGYGPGLCFGSGQARQIAECYCAIGEEQLLAAFKPEEMGKVYPAAFWQRGDEDCVEYLTEHFAALKSFLEVAAKHSLGILVQYT